VLKPLDGHLQFVFITGISKFSQMGIFSGLNHLLNISMTPKYETICGISEEELVTQFHNDIVLLGEANGLDYEQQMEELKETYDGYHFSERMCDMYNPFSLFNAFETQKIDNYWFDRGTSSSLIDILAQMPDIDFAEIENVRVPSTAFDLPLESLDDPLPVLYQSGYLTIKGYDKFFKTYILGMPNQEIGEALPKFILNFSFPKTGTEDFSIVNFARDVFGGKIDGFMKRFCALLADSSYEIVGDAEKYFQNVFYLIFKILGFYAEVERNTSDGRMDAVVKTPQYIYVFEFKLDKPAQEALDQINSKEYALPFSVDGRTLYKIGVSFSSETRKVAEWVKE
jgi:hypothetical protein